MSGLKEVRNRILSVKSTRQITSAMKMIAASRLHRYQQSIAGLREYTASLQLMLDEVLKTATPDQWPEVLGSRPLNRVLVISLASNKGMCGSYNQQVLKATLGHLNLLRNDGLESALILSGKKNEAFLKKTVDVTMETVHELADKPSYGSVSGFADGLIGRYLDGEFDRIDLIYHRFKNALVQEVCMETWMPLPPSIVSADAVSDRQQNSRIIVEPTVAESAKVLVDKYLHMNLLRVFTDAAASEHGARMTAMNKATDSADDLLNELTVSYNKARQAMITREILEIMGGSRAYGQ